MATPKCKARGACGVACGQGPCPLIASWMRKVKHARRAHAELTAMTDRELTDIGLHRSNIGAVVQGTFSR